MMNFPPKPIGIEKHLKKVTLLSFEFKHPPENFPNKQRVKNRGRAVQTLPAVSYYCSSASTTASLIKQIK